MDFSYGTPMKKAIHAMNVAEFQAAVFEEWDQVLISDEQAAQIILSAKRGFPPRWTAESIVTFAFFLDPDAI